MKRSRRSGSGLRAGSLDRISDLPDHIIDNILLRLPIGNAVATSVLSKKWRYKWVTIPEIVFPHPLGRNGLGNGLLETNRLVSAVYHVLLLHKGAITKFAVEFGELENCPDINHWITYLSNHKIQDFSLSRARGSNHMLPSYFYDFVQLTSLKLKGCIFRPPPTFQGFAKLIHLRLDSTVIAVGTLCSLISNCPLLEHLMVSGLVAPTECVQIDAPNLKFFSFDGNVKFICFKNTVFLEEVAISLHSVNRDENQQTSNLIKVAASFPAIKKMCLGPFVLEFLAMGGVPNTLPFHLSNLEVLCLDEMDFSNLDEVSCALSLITSSPNLEEIKVMAYAGEGPMENVVQFFRTHDFSYFCLDGLKKASIEEVSNCGPQLEFIKFILGRAQLLEELEIFRSREMGRREDRRVLKEVTRFRRASPKAEVKYLDP